jgi:hypothetical protein
MSAIGRVSVRTRRYLVPRWANIRIPDHQQMSIGAPPRPGPLRNRCSRSRSSRRLRTHAVGSARTGVARSALRFVSVGMRKRLKEKPTPRHNTTPRASRAPSATAHSLSASNRATPPLRPQVPRRRNLASSESTSRRVIPISYFVDRLSVTEPDCRAGRRTVRVRTASTVSRSNASDDTAPDDPAGPPRATIRSACPADRRADLVKIEAWRADESACWFTPMSRCWMRSTDRSVARPSASSKSRRC